MPDEKGIDKWFTFLLSLTIVLGVLFNISCFTVCYYDYKKKLITVDTIENIFDEAFEVVKIKLK